MHYLSTWALPAREGRGAQVIPINWILKNGRRQWSSVTIVGSCKTRDPAHGGRVPTLPVRPTEPLPLDALWLKTRDPAHACVGSLVFQVSHPGVAVGRWTKSRDPTLVRRVPSLARTTNTTVWSILKNPINWDYLSTSAFPGWEGPSAQVVHPLPFPMRGNGVDPLNNPINENYLSTSAFPGREGPSAQLVHPLPFLICGNTLDPLNNPINWDYLSTSAFPGWEGPSAQLVHPLPFPICNS